MKKLKENQDIIEFIIISITIMVIYGINTSYFSFNIIPTAIAIIFMILNILRFMKKNIFNIIIDMLVKYRYLLYLIIFIFCISLKLHGSSIPVYSEFFQNKNHEEKTILYGDFRWIRSDEFEVLTPYYINQTYNKFNKINHYMSISGQNMIIGYNAPVKDLTLLFKPLNLGYIFLGKEYGLSWYWCMKQILLFAFAFEIFYFLTKKNKVLSILGSFMIAYGPSTQWWFAPHMPDVILWSMGLLVGTYHLISNEKMWIRNMLVFILACIITEFVIALFPSFQIGLGIFMAIILLALIMRDRIKIFQDKSQIIRYLLVLILTTLFVFYFLYNNLDALLASMNTVYPGSRVSLGGDSKILDLLTDLTTIFLSYKSKIPYSNLSEISTYFHFGLFFYFLSPVLIKKLKKEKNRNYIIGIAFVIIMTVYGSFMLLGFPKWLAKITLFSYINRMKMILGIISVFFTIWSIYIMLNLKEKINTKYYLCCTFIYCLIYFLTISKEQLSYLPFYAYILEIILFAIILLGFHYNMKKMSLSLMLGVIMFASIAINPVVRGISDIENHPSATFIQKKSVEDKSSYWIGYDSPIYQSYILANGGKALNAVNFYPDWKKWKIIDEQGKYKDVYNRYAHITIKFSEDDKVHIESPLPDAVKVELPLSKLVDLKVKYLLSRNEIEKENDNYKLSKIYQDSDCIIYEIINKNDN